MHRHYRLSELRPALLLCTALSLAIAGCGGGGGFGGFGSAASRPPPAPLGAPQDPTGTSEFNRNDGLDIVNAEAAYARGATGAGVTVAVIDTGIDADHPDLAGNVSASSYDVIGNSFNVTDATGHGTKVAGVVAAEQNGLGTHGVAHDAGLLAVNAYSCTSWGCGYLYDDLAEAVNYATDQLAHVINMSLSGTSGSSSELRAAIGRAAGAGAFVVIATGNHNASQPGYPANMASDPAFGNRVVAVGAVTDGGSIASFSNDCGGVMNNCLVAPGVGIATTRDGASSATSTVSVSGTSFAAPHVSGALALLVQLYPDAYSADPSSLMMFMLDGARDLGASGVDPIYGHGLLDVEGAIDTADAAITGAAIPTAAGTTASLADTGLSLGAAFGDALAGNALLDRSIAVISLSDGDHAYRARLDDTVATAVRTFGLDALLTANETRTFSMPVGAGLSLVMAVAGDTGPFDGLPEPWSEFDGETAQSMQIAGSLGDNTDFRLGIDVTAEGLTGSGSATPGAETLFWSAGETMGPLPRLAGRGTSLAISQALGDSTQLSLGLFDGEMTDGFGEGGSGSALGQIGLTHGFDFGATIRVDVGALEESDAFLGSQGGGAFATDDGASTGFVTLSGSIPLGRRFELIGGATLATTEIEEQSGSVLGDWDDVLSNAFGIGAIARDVFDDGDRLGLMVGQPLRVFDARATATVPTALGADGNVVQESERVDLAPSGREIDLQFAYDQALAPGMDMSSWLMMQLEPGHDSNADPGFGVGLSFRLAF